MRPDNGNLRRGRKYHVSQRLFYEACKCMLLSFPFQTVNSCLTQVQALPPMSQ